MAAVVGALGGPGQDSQDVLADVVGQSATAAITNRANERLGQTVRELFAGEHRRYATVVGGLALDPEAPAAVRAAARRVDDVRWAIKNNETN